MRRIASAFHVLVAGLGLTLGGTREAEACDCAQFVAFPKDVAPPDTLIYIQGYQVAADEIVLAASASGDVIPTTVLLGTPRFAVVQPDELLDEGSWTVRTADDASVTTFEVIDDDVAAPAVPRIAAIDSFSEGEGASSCAPFDYLRYTFEEPAAAILVQVVGTNAADPPESFELFGETAHAFTVFSNEQKQNLLFVGDAICFNGVGLAKGESAQLRFAAVTPDGAISDWSEPESANVPGGCSIVRPIGGAGGSRWLVGLLALLHVRRSRKARRLG